MDTRLSQALERSNFMATFSTQKRLLWEQYQDNLICYKNGHEIPVTSNLISLCSCFLQSNRTGLVITDANFLPVSIENAESFLEEILEIYASASNHYYAEYQKLIKQRTVEGLVDL